MAHAVEGHAQEVNPIGFLIPCRVIRANGAAGNRRWGADRKLAMLAMLAMLAWAGKRGSDLRCRRRS
ncbi:MGMT family protein [Extensimonas sp. H3M7-6]|uniref:MGMT family protein n=1 Tax=Extensimonas soli TaxID=3031322 RepID=UPI0023DA4387|nr:MGMT family protein [Extensimonas sp. H3M7-6]MDF1482591.1 MGMT family protein [Extensimonas sp. H3M7-6]